MAPGDREWAEAAERRKRGIPLDPVTVTGFSDICDRYDVAFPTRVE